MHAPLVISPRRRIFVRAGAAALATGTLGLPGLVHAAAGGPVKIGILQPFSGGLEALGEQGFQGGKMAIDEINEAGGLLGHKVELVRADTRTDPKTAVERAQELIRRDGVDAILGPLTSAERDAVRPTIERAKVPLLYATDYEGGTCSRYITCFSALPAAWVEPLISYASKNVGKKLYLIGSDYIWPKRMNEAVRASAQKNGATVLGEEYVPFGIKDYASTLRKIEASGADTLVVSVVGADAVTLIKQFAGAGLKRKLRVLFFGFSENYLAGLSTQESDDIVTVSSFTSTLKKPEAADFVKKVRERFGPQTIVSNNLYAHYNLMRFYFGGVQRAKTADKERVTDAMLGQTLATGNGEVLLRASDRHVDLNTVISVAKGGSLDLLQDVGRVVAPSQCKKA
ncbi:Aliphatic amidase expression-regulating protein [Variovorax sp. PBS-H4]|uniref:substrate-binding protein n=1 Tax=Variovorax sp. PBS-H4 TaxID=434008 RepID=UPI001316A548|nr:substrate-binding protein [Variovorax sp. PBS-H4]VTU39932.1 Aliphatic amidase expression-regulating protein [Variovorax sp. PBS-H4]